MNTIFVSIACYRDSDVVNTIHNLYSTALDPDRVFVGVYVQSDYDEDILLRYSLDGLLSSGEKFVKNILVVNQAHTTAVGVGMARYIIQKNLYAGEDYYLQIDSHSRFIYRWDAILIDQIKRRKGQNNKVIISTYPHSFEEYEEYRRGTFIDSTVKIEPNGLSIDGVYLQTSSIVKEKITEKVPFLAGGFIFAEGLFVDEVRYDKDIYFEGEETSLAARAYTHGWDIYNPSRAIVFHDYDRRGNRHWDHCSDWVTLDTASKKKYSAVISGKATSYGLGAVRTFDEWLKFAGYLLDNIE